MTQRPPTSTPSRLRRFACMMYEGVLLFGVVFLAAYLFDTLTQSKHAMLHRHARQSVLFVVIGAYFILCWRYRGQTLPMKTWGICLVERDQRVPALDRLVLRYLLLWPVPLAGAALVWSAARLTGWPAVDMFIVAAPLGSFVWSWFDSQGMFLHDRLLGTRLVDAQGAREARSVPTSSSTFARSDHQNQIL